MVVPRFVRQALKNEPIQVYRDGQQSPCFVDVLDVTDAVSKLSEHPGAIGQVFNIGTDQEITILNLAKRVLELTGSSSTIQYLPYEEAYTSGFEDMRRRVPSIEKNAKLIGFAPRYSLDEILKRVISFERERLS
jgi:UDP-glucose 4-epimerase